VVAPPKDDDLEEIDQKDDGYIELVLRVLARMCDGQHKGLQVYSVHYSTTTLLEIPVNTQSFYDESMLEVGLFCFNQPIITHHVIRSTQSNLFTRFHRNLIPSASALYLCSRDEKQL